MDNVNVTLSLHPKLILALAELAESKNISFSGLCRSMLEQCVREESDMQDKKDEFVKAKTSNKRKYPRHEVSVPATITLAGQEVDPNDIKVVDISLGGALLSLPKGHELLKNLVNETCSFDLTLDLPNEDAPIQFTSKASRVKKDQDAVQIGISFDEYSYYDFIKLYNFLG